MSGTVPPIAGPTPGPRARIALLGHVGAGKNWGSAQTAATRYPREMQCEIGRAWFNARFRRANNPKVAVALRWAVAFLGGIR